jgi:excinuclease ABC subunit A
MFSEQFACPDCQISLDELTPRSFSFNSPYGACPKCNGLGTLPEIDERLIAPDPSLSVEEGAIAPLAGVFGAGEKSERRETAWTEYIVRAVARRFGIDLARPFSRLPKRHREILLHGAGDESFRIRGETKAAGRWERTVKWEGVIPNLNRRLHETDSDMIREWILAYFADTPCPDCKGGRLKRETLGVTIRDKNISDYSMMSVQQAREFLEGIEWTPYERQVGGQVVKEILDRLRFMENVGLGYLTLERRSATLAGGEAQRIRLATQIGSQLTGVLYVLDEPSIGLHQRDNRRLLDTLRALRDLGNTVIVVEHDEATIRSADFVVDLGPGAGRLGGEVVAVGPPEAIQAAPHSITGRYLAGIEKISIPERRRLRNDKSLVVVGAAEHNLKAIDVAIPLGLMTCITGVSGSGKSTLVNDILYNALAQQFYQSTTRPGRHKRIDGVAHLDKVINVDQSPIGRTPRSNPATYTGLFSPTRDLFAQLPESRVRGYAPGRFSFNVKGGRCEACEGDGVIKIEMHFLPDVYVECETCKGRRFNRETLEVAYRGRNIADVLEMPAEEALEFFANIPAIRQKLQTLVDVGLGYIHLGQQATTLSGGEAQRIKLAKELSKRNTGRTLYILDEPTTGLHFDDIKKLLNVLNRLVDAGSTVVVIEHNLEVIKTADWIIDLGPEGGDEGGWIVAEGTPEEIARHRTSYTGQFLKMALS